MALDFPNMPSRQINTSTNSQDVVVGNSVKTYYAARTASGSDLLIPNPLDSTQQRTEVTAAATPNTQKRDFDLDFSQTAFIGGRAVINGTVASTGTATSGSVLLEIKHVTSGGTETVLGTIPEADTLIFNVSGMRFLRSMLLTKKRFKRGEKLRLSATLYARNPGAGDPAYLYHDPSNRYPHITAGLSCDSTLILEVPFAAQAEFK